MEAMIRFVDAYRDDHGVEPICRVLEIAPSTYHAHVRRRSQPETAPPRVQRDVELMQEIRRVFDENFQVYGVRKVWRQLRRQGFDVARCRRPADEEDGFARRDPRKAGAHDGC